MHKRVLVQTGALALPIAATDIATFAGVFEAESFFKVPWTALMAAAAFAALQIGALVLAAQPIPATTRRWLVVGIAVLTAVICVSNIATAYLRADKVLPARELLPALGFGSDESGLTVAGSWAYGLALPAVGFVFWNALADHVRVQLEHQREAHLALAQAIQTLKGRG